MVAFEKFFEALQARVEGLARSNWKDFVDAAEQDGKDYLEEIKEDLRRWTKLLAGGRLKKDEFRILVGSTEDLIKLTALRRAGLSQVRLQFFRTTIIGLVADTACDLFL